MPPALFKLLFILTPLLSSCLFTFVIAPIFYDTSSGNEALGILMLFALFIVTPLVAFVGLIFSFLTRKSENAERLSLYGYGVPAGMFLVYLVGMIIVDALA